MNATKQGINAGQSTRKVVNHATHSTIEAGKTVATAVGGFFKGFLASEYPVQSTKRSVPSKVTAKPKARSSKAK